MKRLVLRIAIALGFLVPHMATNLGHAAATDKPNIVMIMTDDLGYWNVGAYSHGMMVPTPNIDRLAKEGLLFTDHYAEPTCTPARAAFITGQMPIRTGLTTVGMPGSPIGLSEKDPTLAEVLRELGYRSGQFGKNHVGDRNEHLPTVHGFDEFFGNLYHLNTEEEPEQPDWPKDEGFTRRMLPRGTLDCVATEAETQGEDPRFGKWGKQRCTDTGPLTAKRMETVDEEFVDRTLRFIERSTKEGTPFFAYYNPTRMHVYTHLRANHRYLAAPYSSDYDLYGSGLMELDLYVGKLLAKLDELRIADNTIVLFTTDNGAMAAWWPDGGTTPFRGEKATTWEGGVRVPMLIRWPKIIPTGSVSNGIQSHMDLFTTLAQAAGVADVADKLKKSHRVQIDGINNLDHWRGVGPSKRTQFIYYNEQELTAVRIGPWKAHLKQREGFFDYNKPSFLIFNLRMDPVERHDGIRSNDLAMKKGWLGGFLQQALTEHYASLKEFPPRRKGGSLQVE